MNKSRLFLPLACLALSISALADDSTFLCKQIDADNTLVFSATTVTSKDSSGTYGTPVDVEFGYTPNGDAPVWTTRDGSTKFVLMLNQIYVLDGNGNVHGKIVCE